MAGPCSLPSGDKRRWLELNEVVCAIHFHCDMDVEKTHDYVTYRVWLNRRGRLQTGKTS